MPSRFRTARPPSLPTMPAVRGDTTPSIAAASSGSSKRYGPSVQVMSMSSGSRVRREGTIAMSSKPYARRPFLPRPISTSIEAHPTFDGGRNGDDSSAFRPHRRAETALFAGNLSGADRGLRERFHRHLGHQPIHLRRVDHTGAHVADRLRAASHRGAQALVGAPP